jgi:chromatin remodeling complex protein RSC6
MVRTASSKTTTASSPAAAASAAPSVKKAPATKKVAAAPSAAAAAASSSASSAASSSEAAGQPEENKIVSETSETASKMVEIYGQINQVSTVLSSLKNNYKVLEKLVNKELKAAQKSSGKNKKKRDGAARKPSGFNIPTLISDELAAFLGKPSATKLARVDVTNAFNTYIKANSLHDPTNGRYILPDAALTRLLKLTPTDRLSYFNLQAFIKHHFIKEVAAPAAIVA